MSLIKQLWNFSRHFQPKSTGVKTPQQPSRDIISVFYMRPWEIPKMHVHSFLVVATTIPPNKNFPNMDFKIPANNQTPPYISKPRNTRAFLSFIQTVKGRALLRDLYDSICNDYPSNDNTFWFDWLACANIAVPA